MAIRQISIISRPLFWHKDRIANKEFVVRLSARVRGQEIADYLGCKFNSGRSDVNIYIKPRVSMRGIQDGDYVDILDSAELVPVLKQRPLVRVIAMSQVQYDYLKKELKTVVLIPHHHINTERFRRVRNDKLVGGFIGSPSKVAYEMYDKIRWEMTKINVDFTYNFHFKTREEMVEYYKSIDFLVIFNLNSNDNPAFRHPAKIINAASFGIPTFAIPIEGYREVEGFYFPIQKVEDIDLNKLTPEFSDKIYQEAEKYHISKIAEEYKKL